MKPVTAALLSCWLAFAAAASVPAQSACSWAPVAAPIDNDAFAIEVFDDGTGPALYVGGNLTMAGGAAASRIARWDGTVWSALGTGLNTSVLSLGVFDDGSGPALYAGGLFSMAGNIAVNRVARWSGSAWAPLGAGITGSFFASVRTMEVFDDGAGAALYVGGEFPVAGTMPANNIARWGGTAWSLLGGFIPGTNATVWDLEVFDDGSGSALYAAGNFTMAGGAPANYVARWDGTAWSPVGAGLGNGVRALAVFDDGTGPALFAGGELGVLAKWDGSIWTSLSGGVPTGTVSTLNVFDDGSGPCLYVGGDFTSIGALSVNGIAKWDGSTWSALGSGIGGSIPAISDLGVYDAGSGPELYAGGSFTSAGASSASWIAAWSCGSTISVSMTQNGAGSPIFLNNANLTPGGEYFNVFSLTPCAGGPGTGAGPLGSCLATPASIQFVTNQLLMPVGAAPFHVTAPFSYANWGPYTVPPLTADAICIGVGPGGSIGPVSPVVRITVQ